MRQIVATLRRSPASLVGVLVALIAAAAMVTVVAGLIGTSVTMKAPVHRLAATTAVVVGDQHVRYTTGHGENKDTTSLPLNTYRRVPADLVGRMQQLPGVHSAVGDVSLPVAVQVNGRSAGVTGHGWQSAALTPFRLTAGHEPTGASDIVLAADVAHALHAAVGDQLRLSGQDLAPFTVTGIAAAPPGNPAGASTIFSPTTKPPSCTGIPARSTSSPCRPTRTRRAD